ncbi:Patatin [[Leptolyngbya] sp. PCC 7376]|uniref:patatin-like phospholipase family protein n=1 Tax=[Leptolyngbya] sp. PCC 7376 TaxID=111781 RepID=UPI00029F37D6|nr:patatin-like phospholipase family protein [[Leptolyngbya] sp. PCC 7376]AFY36824.1 Patatin [[Leptolyngbya] sp. PCC 7376]
MTTNERPYKILALDGGGFRGVMTAQILAKIEAEISAKYDGCKLHEYFDLVTGTSTGSLLAAGIALGMSAKELLDLYEENGDRIFPSGMRFRRRFTGLLSNLGLYNNKTGLGKVLEEKFGDVAMGALPDEAPVLLIPSYDLTARRTNWFCSNNPKTDPVWYDSVPIWKICTCSSAAPTFFPPFELPYKDGTERPFIDGGVSVNNPALIGIAHALFLPYRDAVDNPPDYTLNDLAVLSIGTGESIEPFSYKQVRRWGALKWVQRLPDLFLPAPNEVNAAICWQIIRQESDENAKRVLRLDYALPSREQYMDNEGYSKLKEVESVHQAFLKKQFGAIDNPDLFKAYKDFAQCYLDGELLSRDLARTTLRDSVPPNEAIAEFIENNQYPTNKYPHKCD